MNCYRVTAWLPSTQLLENWLEYFRQRGTPAAIVRRTEHPPYSIWKEGRDLLDKPRAFPPGAVIEQSVNNFEKEVRT